MQNLDVVVLTALKYFEVVPEKPISENIILEDNLVLEALKNTGLNVARIAWDDPDFDWSSTRFVLIKTPWDYFDRIKEFKQWFSRTAELTKFINSKKLIDWNIDKHYLQELNEKGIHIPPTLFIEAGHDGDLRDAIGRAKDMGFNSDEFVLKPCIAAGSRHTYKFHLSEWEKHNAIFKELVSEEAMILQEFQKNIVNEGEVSMMVIGGKYTHAVLKKAKSGDFRVQDDYGGTVQKYIPSQVEIEFAERAIGACIEMPLYGRADIFKDNEGKTALAELEIFEPELWFRFEPKAATALAKSIKNNFFK